MQREKGKTSSSPPKIKKRRKKSWQGRGIKTTKNTQGRVREKWGKKRTCI